MVPAIISRKKVYENFFLVEEIVCKSRRTPENFKRFVLSRPDSAAIVLHDPDNDEVVFVRQFRAPALDKDSPDLLELPAGIIEEGETPTECIIRESIEETGYEPRNPEFICYFYPSPGISSERIHIFYGRIDLSRKKSDGGGIEEENEDLAIENKTLPEAYKMISQGQLIDGKTIIGLQWLHSKPGK